MNDFFCNGFEKTASRLAKFFRAKRKVDPNFDFIHNGLVMMDSRGKGRLRTTGSSTFQSIDPLSKTPSKSDVVIKRFRRHYANQQGPRENLSNVIAKEKANPGSTGFTMRGLKQRAKNKVKTYKEKSKKPPKLSTEDQLAAIKALSA